MTADQQIRDTYPDLLDGDRDSTLARLVGNLDRLYRPSAPPAEAWLMVARALANRSVARRAVAARDRRLPAVLSHHLGIVVTVLLAVLVLAAAAAPVVAPLLDQIFARNPRAQRIDGQRLGRDINLSQTVNGFTVTVGRVYADANQIVIGYTVTGPAGRSFAVIAARDSQGPGLPTLTDAQGRRFPVAPALVESPATMGNQASGLLYYETASITGAPNMLSLHLTIGSLWVAERPAGSGTPGRVSESCVSRDCAYSVPGPFVFNFTVPFQSGRTVVLNQSVEVGGTMVTLERVVTTPTGTRVYLRGAGPNLFVDLVVDEVVYPLRYPGPGSFIPVAWVSDSSWYFQTPEPLGDKYGEWILVVRPGERTRSLTPPEGGPWTFHFNFP